MKVVLFCGGLGMRLREYTENVPKPMVKIGTRPILWHLMKYYAHFGHKEFVLCLGYRGEVIKRFFLNYEESTSNDFIFSRGGQQVELLNSDIHDWRITFVDTGQTSNIGERLARVKEFLVDDDLFLANYADGLTDLHLPAQVEALRDSGKVASFLCVPPNLSYHFIERSEDGTVTSLRPFAESGVRVNGGFFVFRRSIFDYIRDGEDLVAQPFFRLIRDRQLVAYDYDGFWQAVDTAKDKERVERLYDSGSPPWMVWKRFAAGEGARGGPRAVPPDSRALGG